MVNEIGLVFQRGTGVARGANCAPVVIPGRRDRGEPGIQCGAADRNRALESGFALTRATRNDTRSEAAANPGALRLSV
jgi:hypothetical protein